MSHIDLGPDPTPPAAAPTSEEKLQIKAALGIPLVTLLSEVAPPQDEVLATPALFEVDFAAVSLVFGGNAFFTITFSADDFSFNVVLLDTDTGAEVAQKIATAIAANPGAGLSDWFDVERIDTRLRFLIVEGAGAFGSAVAFQLASNGSDGDAVFSAAPYDWAPSLVPAVEGSGTAATMVGDQVVITHSDGSFSQWGCVQISPTRWAPMTAGVILNRTTALWERLFVEDSTIQTEPLPDQEAP